MLFDAIKYAFLGSNPLALRGILREAVKAFICPPALVLKCLVGNPQANHYVDNFFSNCIRPFTNFLQLCGHNRARQRDKLAHLLEEFTTLQDEVWLLHEIKSNFNFHVVKYFRRNVLTLFCTTFPRTNRFPYRMSPVSVPGFCITRCAL